MNKADFLRRLDAALPGPPQEKGEILADYEEHFRIGLGEGQTEEEIAASLGDPRSIGRAYAAERLVRKAGADQSAGNIIRAVLAVISLSFFNLVVVLGPFCGLVGALAGLWAAAVALTFAGLAVFLAALFSPFLSWLMPGISAVSVAGAVFAGLGLAALGLLCGIGLAYVTAGAYKLTVKYLKFNLKVITGEKD